MKPFGTLPLAVAFSEESGVNPQDLTVEILFGIDIFMNFFSAFEDKLGNVVDNLPIIVRHYCVSFMARPADDYVLSLFCDIESLRAFACGF